MRRAYLLFIALTVFVPLMIAQESIDTFRGLGKLKLEGAPVMYFSVVSERVGPFSNPFTPRWTVSLHSREINPAWVPSSESTMWITAYPNASGSVELWFSGFGQLVITPADQSVRKQISDMADRSGPNLLGNKLYRVSIKTDGDHKTLEIAD